MPFWAPNSNHFIVQVAVFTAALTLWQTTLSILNFSRSHYNTRFCCAGNHNFTVIVDVLDVLLQQFHIKRSSLLLLWTTNHNLQQKKLSMSIISAYAVIVSLFSLLSSKFLSLPTQVFLFVQSAVVLSCTVCTRQNNKVCRGICETSAVNYAGCRLQREELLQIKRFKKHMQTWTQWPLQCAVTWCRNMTSKTLNPCYQTLCCYWAEFKVSTFQETKYTFGIF